MWSRGGKRGTVMVEPNAPNPRQAAAQAAIDCADARIRHLRGVLCTKETIPLLDVEEWLTGLSVSVASLILDHLVSHNASPPGRGSLLYQFISIRWSPSNA